VKGYNQKAQVKGVDIVHAKRPEEREEGILNVEEVE